MITGMTMPMAGVPLEGSRLEIGLTIMHPQDLHEVKRVDQKTDSAATCCDAGQIVRTVVRLRAVFHAASLPGCRFATLFVLATIQGDWSAQDCMQAWSAE
ncbi:hypothetical protein WQE_18294 [Paraburkholderia hospita]|uniref:Uncharacterized protein n=1 Tax=Paraburkholderia hospita TaxID=169430 RepID=A0AAN1JDW3_9BURK|nr:hypothetical protein C2L64_27140 [Paraburkholderia hospita]EIM99585.1 hypothetical protein WQE_18294 [Paraburkholderia hospita]OUL70867.1 hypothetical protein CA601_46775 [Paraburkholderia hospita]